VCPTCGRFHSGLTSVEDGTCQACGSDLKGRRRLWGTFIRPEFGFIAEYGEPRPSGETRPQRIYSSRLYFSDYRAPEHVIDEDQGYEAVASLSSERGQILRRYSRYGWLALVNPGPLGRGFRVCSTCGFAEPVPLVVKGQKRGKPAVHTNPRTGRDCSTYTETLHLGHEFMTDVLELRFDGYLASDLRDSMWYSVLYALLEGSCEALGIQRDDLDGTIYHHAGGAAPALVVFDNVPGGAGLVQRVSQDLDTVFVAAWERMDRACCGEDTSCYECLRNFRNQPYHEQLKRSLARDFLHNLLEEVQLLQGSMR